MAMEFKLPHLGENIESGDVIKVLVSVGDQVAKQQPVLELETDKAVVEVPSSIEGVVEKIHVQEGDKATVGQLVLTLSGEPAAKAASKSKAGGEEAVAGKSEPEPEKEVEPEPEPEPEPEDRRRGEKPDRGAEVVNFAKRSRPSAESAREPIPASPSVRRLAREIGVDIYRVQGSGSHGRISRDDVKSHAKDRLSGSVPTPAGAAPALPDFTRWGEVRRERFSNVRRKTAEHMALCWSVIPHVTQHDRCDVTDLERRRKQFAKKAEAKGGKLTVTAIILKVVGSALKVFPKFNASLDVEAGEIVYKESVHVGVAVDTPRGLLVPVVRDVDRKNILELSGELLELAEKARSGKVAPDDLQGGGFTITNLGGIGGVSFTPIVNWPEVAILGVSRASVQPVYNDGQFTPREILPLSLSYDHRLIDGADAARFLRWVAEALEDPFLLLLEG